MLRFGEPDAPFDSWKVWERGAPHLAVEITSASDAEERPWEGSAELDAALIVVGDLVERDPTAFTRSVVLGVHFCAKLGPIFALREGKDLLPTPDEARLTAEARVRELEAEIARRVLSAGEGQRQGSRGPR